MTLSEYLSSNQAIEDVRALIADLPAGTRPNGTFKPAGEAARRVNNHTALMTLRRDGAWMRVHLALKREDLLGFTPVGSAYYRPDGSGSSIVSDLGESVSGVMRRTGLECEAAQDKVHEAIENGVSLEDFYAPGLDGCAIRTMRQTADDLPAAIVALLCAVQKASDIR